MLDIISIFIERYDCELDPDIEYFFFEHISGASVMTLFITPRYHNPLAGNTVRPKLFRIRANSPLTRNVPSSKYCYNCNRSALD